MKLGRFWPEERGSILVEAALTIPVLLMLFIGMVEFTGAYSAKKKADAVAAATADLVAQSPSPISTANLTDIATIANNLMLPYSTTPLTLTITSVTLGPNNTPVVVWSFPTSATGPQPGASFPLPSNALIAANQCIIVSQTTYVYTPVLAQFLTSAVTFTSSAYFQPRLVPCLSLSPSS
jgi:hypothetical protein